MKEYICLCEEVKERDYCKLGKEFDLFMVFLEVGFGLLFWFLKGVIIWCMIECYIVDKEVSLGY